MNDKYTIAAIAMFAVVLGLGAFAPALAAKEINPNSSADSGVCHYFEEEVDEDTGEVTPAQWNVKYVNSNGAMNGHQKHGDPVIGDATDLAADPPTITEDDCRNQVLPVPEPEEPAP